MLDLLLLLWKAGGGLKCGSMFHLDEWVAPPSPPPKKKNRFFYFLAVSSNRVYTTSRFDFALMGVMAN